MSKQCNINAVDQYDKETIDEAMRISESKRRTMELVNNAKENGRYADSRKRIKTIIDKGAKLIGKTLRMDSLLGNGFKDEVIKSTEMIDSNTVRINGKYNVALKEGMTTDSAWMVEVDGVELGSEADVNSGETVLLKEYSGTLSENMEQMFYDAVDTDGANLSDLHYDRLFDVLDSYNNAIKQSGEDIEISGSFLEDVMIDSRKNTRGSANPETGRFRVIMGNMKNTTATEVLAHELQHIMVSKAIQKHPPLKADIRKLRELVKAKIDKQLGANAYQVFITNRAREGGITSEDIEWAKSMYNYAFNSSKMPEDEFLALATTNEALMNNLEVVKELDAKLFSGFKNDNNNRILTVLNRIIDKLNKAYSSMFTNGKSSRELASELLGKALEMTSKDMNKKDRTVFDKANDMVSDADKRISGFTKKIKKEQESLEDVLAEETETKYDKFVERIWKIRGLAEARSFMLQNNIFSTVTRNTNNKDVLKLYEMFRQSKKLIDKTTVEMKGATVNVLETKFGMDKKNVSLAVRKSAKRGLLDTDIKALGDIKVIKKALDKKIDGSLKDTIKTMSEGLDEFTLQSSKDLATLMVHGKATGNDTMLNASRIALTAEGNLRKKKRIDRLTTLLALDMVDIVDVENTLELVKSNPKGVEAMIKMMEANEKDMLDKAYGGNEVLMTKGWKQEHYGDNKKYYVVDKKEMEDLVRAGMQNIGKDEVLSDVFDGDRYIVIGDSLDTAYTEGLMSIVQIKNEGESIRSMLKSTGMYDPIQIDEKIDKLGDSKYYRAENFLAADRALNGEVTDYRFRLGQDVKEKYMGLDNDIVFTVGHSVANITHKEEAMINNKAAVRFLDKFHRKYKDSKKFQFMEISEKSTGKAKEYYDIIPGYLKSYIKNNVQGGKLVIEESMLVDFFGYKDASLVNTRFIKSSKVRQKYVRMLEKTVQELSGRWKKIIVTMTGGTITNNLGSNMFVTMQNTELTSPVKYLEKFKDAWLGIEQYQADVKEINELEIMKKSGNDIDENRLASLRDSVKNNHVAEVIDDGQYNIILEDIDSDVFNNKGPLAKKIDEALEKIKKDGRRENIKAIMDELYLTNDSKLFKQLVKLTMYGDVINRIIIHNYNMEKGEMSKRDSLNYVDGLFVNYAYLDNKYIKYMNDHLFFAFTKYFFRTIPAMIKMGARKPLSMFLAESSQVATDINLETPMDQMFNPIKTLIGKLFPWGNAVDMMDVLITPNIARPIKD